jgi:hypothetical protein
LPTALELLTIKDSEEDPIPIEQRAKEAIGKDADQVALLVKKHQLAAEDLQRGHWVASLVAERNMLENAARRAL